MLDYLQKVERKKNKTHQPGQPEPKDDHDLANWLARCREEFFVKFKAELEVSTITIPEWKKVSCNLMPCLQWCLMLIIFAKNSTRNITTRKARHHTPLRMRHCSSWLKRKPVVSRDLFRDSIRDLTNKEATNWWNTSNMDRKQHTGLFQMILKECWDALSDDDKEQWHKATMEMNEKCAREHQDPVYRHVASQLLCY